MSMPIDYNQQLLGFIQTWRQLLEQWGAMIAGAAFPHAPSVMPTTPAGGQFMPPGMPFSPAGTPPMPPTAPLAPPSPADYTQQLFGYLQAWRQYLEQMAGGPASPQPSTAPPPTASSSGNSPVTSSAGATWPAPSPVVQRPPANDTGSKEPGPPEGVPASNFGKSVASGSAKLPPVLKAHAPADEGGSQLPDHMSVDHDGGLWRMPNPPGPFGGPKPPAVFRPPIFDYGNQWVPRQYRAEAESATGAPTPPPRRSPAAALAQRAVGSPFRGVMGRVTGDASPQFKPQTLFKNAGQSPSP